MHAVDIAHERRVNAESQQLLHTSWITRGDLQRNGQRHVLELAGPWLTVLRRDAETRPIGAIGASSVPDGAEEHHHRSGGHRHAAPAGIVGLRSLVTPAMAARNELGGAVVGREVVDGPDGAD